MSDHNDTVHTNDSHHSGHALPADIIPEGSWQDKLLISCAIVALLGLGSVGYGFDIGGIQVAHAQESEQSTGSAPAEGSNSGEANSNSQPAPSDGANAGSEGAASDSQPSGQGQGEGTQAPPAPAE